MRNPWLRKSAVGFEDGRRKPRRIEGCNCLKSMVCRCPVPPYRDGGRFRMPPSWGAFTGNGAADGLCLVVESGSMACRIGKTASRPEYCGRFGDRFRERFVSSGPASTCFRGTSGRLPERACVSGHFVVGPLLAVSRAAVRTADGIRWALRRAGPGSGRGFVSSGPIFPRFRPFPEAACRLPETEKVPDRNRIPFSFSERCVYRCTVFLMSFTLS